MNTERSLSRAMIPAIPLMVILSILVSVSVAQLGGSAEENYQKGLEFEAEQSRRGFMQAKEAYQRAVNRDPTNTIYLMALARMHASTGMPHNARDLYNRVTELDPKNVEAHYKAAHIYANDWYDDFNKIKDGILLAPFCKHDDDQAMSHFQAAIALDEDNREAIRRFLSFALKSRRFNELVNIGRRLISIEPDSPDGYLFTGIGLVRTWRFEEAESTFQLALDKLPEGDRRIYQSSSYVLDHREGRSYRKAGYGDQTRIAAAYWARRDPLYLTDGNERMLEHVTRTACADMLYGYPGRGIRGWETDRGEVYIRYGEPENRVKGVVDDIGGMVSGKSMIETWFYPDFQIHFEDYFLSGRYRFHQQSEMEIYGIIHDLPSDHEVDFLGPQFDFPFVISAFKDRDPDRTILEISLGVPLRQLFVVDSKAVVKEGIFLIDGEGERVREIVAEKEFEVEDGETDPERHLADQRLISAPPGSYLLAVEAADGQGDSFGSERIEIEIPDFGADELMLSDLSLAGSVNVTGGSATHREDISVDPRPGLSFSSEDQLALYFGVYNLTIGADGRSRYRVATTISNLARPSPAAISTLQRFFGRVFGFGPEEGLSITSNYSGPVEDEIRVITIDLKNMPANVYRLQVEVEDSLSGQKIRKERVFKIIQPD